MKHKLVRIAISVPEALIALSAIGGGIALLAGTYKDGVLIEAGGRAQFPLAWLQQTPLSDYTIPALILTIGVGGSSLITAMLVFTSREVGVLASIMAGLIIAGYIVVEVVMLRQAVSWIEGLYFGLGLLISGLAAYLWMVEDQAYRSRVRRLFDVAGNTNRAAGDSCTERHAQQLDKNSRLNHRRVWQVVSYGDITGSFTTEGRSIVHPDNTASFSGRDTCTCTVAGKSGTLMWNFTGTQTADGSFQGQFFNLLGTGDLAKLHGQGEFQGQGNHWTYSAELHFDA